MDIAESEGAVLVVMIAVPKGGSGGVSNIFCIFIFHFRFRQNIK